MTFDATTRLSASLSVAHGCQQRQQNHLLEERSTETLIGRFDQGRVLGCRKDVPRHNPSTTHHRQRRQKRTRTLMSNDRPVAATPALFRRRSLPDPASPPDRRRPSTPLIRGPESGRAHFSLGALGTRSLLSPLTGGRLALSPPPGGRFLSSLSGPRAIVRPPFIPPRAPTAPVVAHYLEVASTLAPQLRHLRS